MPRLAEVVAANDAVGSASEDDAFARDDAGDMVISQAARGFAPGVAGALVYVNAVGGGEEYAVHGALFRHALYFGLESGMLSVIHSKT